LRLEDLLQDRVKLLKLIWVAFWVSMVFLVIGYIMIIQDLLG
jgi:hypothetical protein